MGERAEHYRAKVTECERAAQTAPTDQPIAKSYSDLARQWRELARQVEMLDRERPKP